MDPLALPRVDVYLPVAGAWTAAGQVLEFVELGVEQRFNQPGTWRIKLIDSGVDALSGLTDDELETVLVVVYSGATQLVAGVPQEITREGDAQGRRLSITGMDVMGRLQRRLAYPVPTAALGAQTLEADVRTGAAETVALAYISAALTRIPFSPVWTIAATGGRGPTVTGRGRMDPLWDVVQPLLAAGQVGLRVVFVEASKTLRLEGYAPADLSADAVLSVIAGTLDGWSWTRTDADASAAVVGGAGDGAAREFVGVNMSGTATAAQFDTLRYEVFVDARDVVAGATSELTQRGIERLTELRQRTGFTLTPAPLAAPAVYGVGDIVSVELGEGVVATDVVRGITWAWSSSGPRAVPQVGDPDADVWARWGRALGLLQNRLRSIETRK